MIRCFFVQLLRALLLASLVSLAGGVLAQDKAVITTPQVRAELLAHAPQGVLAASGRASAPPVWVALQLTHQPHWHTYWKNSGDSGLPTSLEWTLPPGVMAGDIAWPLPRKIIIGPLTNYGYEGTLLLPVPLTITPEFKPGFGQDSLPIKLKASWLVCRQECIPEEGEFSLNLPLRSSTALNGAAFDAALAAQPQALKAGKDSRIQVEGEQLQIQVGGLPSAWRGKALEVFPETPEIIDNGGESGKRWVQGWNGPLWTATLPISTLRSASPTQLPLVLIQGGRGLRAVLPVSGAWPNGKAKAEVSPALAAALAANAGAASAPAAGASAAATTEPVTAPVNLPPTAPVTPSTLGWLSALVGAMLGGLILNLMPCVFPVLAIKVLGFAQHADDRRAHRISGLAYTAGVLASFLALGALLLALRAAGESLGWGFQLQNPWVVAALAALFTVLGLNLAGLFEFGQFLPSSLASLHARHPVLDAFLTGVLAVAVASPCTAPFMGAALGLAVGLPTVQALAVFAAIGLGLALPYLLASWIPAVAYALPRPGAWMATFRHLLAFPMFATVVWLVWVLGQQSGINGVTALLALLVSGAFVIWTLTLEGRARWLLGALAALVTGLLATHLGPELAASSAPTATTNADSHGWQPWSSEREASLRASGQPVFVDFTAAWCVTCQYNKKTTLANPAVLADLSAKKVQLLRADWTRRDPAITAALAQLGRNGVPVYVLYAPGQTPVVLSEVLSVDEVRAALARL